MADTDITAASGLAANHAGIRNHPHGDILVLILRALRRFDQRLDALEAAVGVTPPPSGSTTGTSGS